MLAPSSSSQQRPSAFWPKLLALLPRVGLWDVGGALLQAPTAPLARRRQLVGSSGAPRRRPRAGPLRGRGHPIPRAFQPYRAEFFALAARSTLTCRPTTEVSVQPPPGRRAWPSVEGHRHHRHHRHRHFAQAARDRKVAAQTDEYICLVVEKGGDNSPVGSSVLRLDRGGRRLMLDVGGWTWTWGRRHPGGAALTAPRPCP